MMFINRCVALLLVFAFHSSVWSADGAKEIFAATSLVEMSPEVAGEYHRILGKIEGSVKDPKTAEAVQARFSDWLEKAGNPNAMTFDDAQVELVTKLRAVGKSFDAVKDTGNLSSWPEGVPVASTVKPISVEVQKVALAVNPDLAKPAQGSEKDHPLDWKYQIAIYVTLVPTLFLGIFAYRKYPYIFSSTI